MFPTLFLHTVFEEKPVWLVSGFELGHSISYKITYAPSKDWGQFLQDILRVANALIRLRQSGFRQFGTHPASTGGVIDLFSFYDKYGM